MSSAGFLNSRQIKLAMEARKKMEQEKMLMEVELDNSKKIAHRTAFEITTTAKIERRLRQDSLQGKKEALERQLFNRRTQLADLYNTEMEFWRSQVLAQKETMEDRKAEMLERAYALRDAREAARKKLIQDKLDALWRDGCDDARSLDSKELNRFMGAERQRQIADKENRRKDAAAVETVFLSEWTKQLNVMEEKDRAKQDARSRANADTAAGLEQQIRQQDEMRADHSRKQQEESEREIAEVRKALADEAALRERLQQDAVQRGKDVMAYNAMYKDIRAQEAAVDAERDAILLQEALKKEREKIAEENSKAEAGYEAARQYRKYLEALMVKEKEDNGVLDQVCRAESEKVWKARDDALKARADARDYLMKLVNEGRKQQIEAKKAAIQAEKENDKKYSTKFIEDIKEGIALDKGAADIRRRLAEENNAKLIDQIAERRRAEDKVKQDAYIEEKRMKHIEKQHQERLKLQAGNLRLNFPLKRPDY